MTEYTPSSFFVHPQRNRNARSSNSKNLCVETLRNVVATVFKMDSPTVFLTEDVAKDRWLERQLLLGMFQCCS